MTPCTPETPCGNANPNTYAHGVDCRACHVRLRGPATGGTELPANPSRSVGNNRRNNRVITAAATSRFLSLPCVNEGEVLVKCPSCAGSQGDIRACEIHGRCTRKEMTKGTAACATCDDYATTAETTTGAAPPVPFPPGDFEWVSTDKLVRDAVALAGLLPPDTSGIVGVPRSGMIPAAVISTHLHLPLYELTAAGELNRLGHGGRGKDLGFYEPTGPLAVVDDTVYGGHAMKRARAAMGRTGRKAVFAAVYSRLNATPGTAGVVDVFARALPSPHLLEWNAANNGPLAGHSANPVYGTGVAMDLDGVVLHDADSGGAVGTAYMVPRSLPVPLIATGRPERHRAVTEAALRSLGVKWKRLVMLPDGVLLTPQSAARHKAEHYAASGCGFYLESDPLQAELIHHHSGLPVVCPKFGKVWAKGGAPAPLPKQLLPDACAAPIFAPLVGKRVALVHSPATGNAGDRLIEMAAEQLLARFGVGYEVREPGDPGDADVVVLFGGGNYGIAGCEVEAARRAAALATGVPCVLLPQTAYGPEPAANYHRAFVRDVESSEYIPGAVLAPDLVLFFRPPHPLPPPVEERGEFFNSTYPESLYAGRGTDPKSVMGPLEYLDHVAAHAEVRTDSVHAAVCGLIAGRGVTLYPTKLHKQRSAWGAWLEDLGCRWAGPE